MINRAFVSRLLLLFLFLFDLSGSLVVFGFSQGRDTQSNALALCVCLGSCQRVYVSAYIWNTIWNGRLNKRTEWDNTSTVFEYTQSTDMLCTLGITQFKCKTVTFTIFQPETVLTVSGLTFDVQIWNHLSQITCGVLGIFDMNFWEQKCDYRIV